MIICDVCGDVFNLETPVVCARKKVVSAVFIDVEEEEMPLAMVHRKAKRWDSFMVYHEVARLPSPSQL